jgi:hypothetical protein
MFGLFERLDKGISSNIGELHCINTVLNPAGIVSNDESKLSLIDDVDFDIVMLMLEGDRRLCCLHIRVLSKNYNRARTSSLHIFALTF